MHKMLQHLPVRGGRGDLLAFSLHSAGTYSGFGGVDGIERRCGLTGTVFLVKKPPTPPKDRGSLYELHPALASLSSLDTELLQMFRGAADHQDRQGAGLPEKASGQDSRDGEK